MPTRELSYTKTGKIARPWPMRQRNKARLSVSPRSVRLVSGFMRARRRKGVMSAKPARSRKNRGKPRPKHPESCAATARDRRVYTFTTITTKLAAAGHPTSIGQKKPYPKTGDIELVPRQRCCRHCPDVGLYEVQLFLDAKSYRLEAVFCPCCDATDWRCFKDHPDCLVTGRRRQTFFAAVTGGTP